MLDFLMHLCAWDIKNKNQNIIENISNINYKKNSELKPANHKRSVWKNLLYTFKGYKAFDTYPIIG